MRIYIANGRCVGTQADARTADRAFRQIEMRTDKAGLIEDINKLIDDAAAPAPALPLVAPPPPPPPAPRPRDTVQRDISIEEAIAEADYARALRLAEHIHCRLMEHARAAGAA